MCVCHHLCRLLCRLLYRLLLYRLLWQMTHLCRTLILLRLDDFQQLLDQQDFMHDVPYDTLDSLSAIYRGLRHFVKFALWVDNSALSVFHTKSQEYL